MVLECLVGRIMKLYVVSCERILEDRIQMSSWQRSLLYVLIDDISHCFTLGMFCQFHTRAEEVHGQNVYGKFSSHTNTSPYFFRLRLDKLWIHFPDKFFWHCIWSFNIWHFIWSFNIWHFIWSFKLAVPSSLYVGILGGIVSNGLLNVVFCRLVCIIHVHVHIFICDSMVYV